MDMQIYNVLVNDSRSTVLNSDKYVVQIAIDMLGFGGMRGRRIGRGGDTDCGHVLTVI